MDLATILGIVVGLGLIVGSIMIDGSLGAFINGPGMLIVLGGTIAATPDQPEVQVRPWGLLGRHEHLLRPGTSVEKLLEKLQKWPPRAGPRLRSGP